MRVTRPVAVTVLGLVAAACGGGAPTAHASPSSSSSAPLTTGGVTASGSATHTGGSSTSAVSAATARPTVASAPTRPAASPASPAATPAARTVAPAAPPGPCRAADVALATTTDLSHYPLGQNVQVTVEVRNQSAHSCIFGTAGDFTIDADPAGPSVFAVRMECPPDGCAPLAPGQMSTYPIGWNQVANQGPGAGSPAAAGSYHARAAFPGYPVSMSASFTIG
jgi:hypothetical protein